MPILRAKPVEITGIQYTGDNVHEINRALIFEAVNLYRLRLVEH